ncbi:GNAT family N-acetyltransferase [Thioalkalivibrio denitrificans]|uniref:GNAT family N-acetyltransferase n=1 Tax=Thioalkalivibrio denitrificans TaxID=108003 RepID=A0A1V3NLD2_9GAMM|nr:GNAT family N-acetyltransferase [Thioalkalivibrio denitrificans]OOG25937.1 GNAT family N-acetyltransferase [Thioalkalivibrio denitrificans]
MNIRIVERLDQVPAQAWDALGGDRNPLVSHAFLAGLERYDCLGPRYGWLPRHVLIEDDAGGLQAAMPMYAKTNGYGEFVFDWAWQSAWERSGLAYYPKLVVSVPYTPATGPRLLVRSGADGPMLRQALIRAGIRFARDHRVSGLHWLFPDDADLESLRAEGLSLRMGCQYHWRNDGYRDFDDFLDRFSSKKRKNVRRERRRVSEQGIALRILHGNEVPDGLWETFHGFYMDTFEKKMGIPTLSLDFFRETGRALGRGVVMVLAEHDGAPVAAALCYRGSDSLYGRYWGCARDYDGLHFEACYYQGIEYCIREGLARFEPGAQGEHKIPRGFLPTPTWSAHWLAHEELGAAVADFCHREQQVMGRHCRQLMAHSPFRDGQGPADVGAVGSWRG